MSDAVILIPARYASTRYPGKPLVEIKGPDGKKTLIQRSWEAALSVLPGEQVHVCTDDDRIAEAATGFGAQVIMTSPECRNGTERCAEAVETAGIEAEIVVNLQGDSPLTPAWFLEALIADMRAHPEAGVATPVIRCDHAAWAALTNDRKHGRVGGTTAVMRADKTALYFSKEVIPFTGDLAEGDEIPVFHHVGVYAYRREVLAQYAGWPMGVLEGYEGLEQLRFLERGANMLCTEVNPRGRFFWELNNPTDLAIIEAELRRQHETR